MTRKNIPAGYQLHVRSWENDLDVCKMKIISGLTREDVRFYVELAAKFESKYNSRTHRGLGNSGHTGDVIIEAVESTLKNHPDISEKTRNLWTDDHTKEDSDDEFAYAYQLHETLCETLLDITETYYDESFFCRVVDEFKVYYIPEEIWDMTREFV